MVPQRPSDNPYSASARFGTVRVIARWMKSWVTCVFLLVVIGSFLLIAPAGCQREGEQLEPPSQPPVTPPPEGLNENPGEPQR